jgi:hypothetical protein
MTASYDECGPLSVGLEHDLRKVGTGFRQKIMRQKNHDLRKVGTGFRQKIMLQQKVRSAVAIQPDAIAR